jgi:hypothetical protein
MTKVTDAPFLFGAPLITHRSVKISHRARLQLFIAATLRDRWIV